MLENLLFKRGKLKKEGETPLSRPPCGKGKRGTSIASPFRKEPALSEAEGVMRGILIKPCLENTPLKGL